MLHISKTVFLAIIILFPMASIAKEDSNRHKKDGWTYTVGTGGIVAPSYLGDDNYQLSVLPNIRFAYEDKFFASASEGIGYNIVNNDTWNIGPLARYDFGRDEDGESPFNVGGSDTNDLLGLGDVDGAVELGGFIEYKIRPFSAKIEVLKGTGGHEGIIGDLSIKYSGRAKLVNTNVMYNLGPNIKIADSNYHQSYFGVNSRQSSASGLARYDADAGILSYGLGGMAIIPMNKNISTVVFANYSKLGSESANSSLVQERGSDNQGTFGLFVNYSF